MSTVADPEKGGGRSNVTVVVLGDVGRSPRMQYHALALAAELADVDLVGYRGSELPRDLARHEHVRLHLMPPPRSLDAGRGPLVFWDGLVRLAVQTWRLSRLLLFAVRRPAVVLVQTPPPIPTLGVAWLAARLRGARLVIDWHNLGHTLLALKLGRGHALVRATRWYERFLGRLADAGFCVSRAMRAELEEGWKVRPVRVLYDRPAGHFEPTPPALRDDLLRRLAPALDLPDEVWRDRPAVLLSPTSWTPDEDFSLLIEAARAYEEAARRDGSKRLPPLLVVITGRGPLRDHYVERFRQSGLRRVIFRTLWLTPEDYALLLGAADLGLSLHRSSSALDLPMKIADMFGAGLPVCAVDYGPVVAEQVRAGENGQLFTSGDELGRHLTVLFEHFPQPHAELERLRRGARKAARKSWEEGWREEALPVLERWI